MASQPRITHQQRLSDALDDLIARIENGSEFPDAQWAASQTHAVSADSLMAAYDEHCYDAQQRSNPQESLAYAYID